MAEWCLECNNVRSEALSDRTPLSSGSINEPPPALADARILRDGTWLEMTNGMTWASTPNIRWCTEADPAKAGGIIPVLQQLWRCVESGAVQWRRVPCVSQPSGSD